MCNHHETPYRHEDVADLIAYNRRLIREVSRLSQFLREHYLFSPATDGSGSRVHRTVCVGDLTVDLRGWRVLLGQRPLHLSKIQFRLLASLAQCIGEVVSYDTLLKEVWGCAVGTGDRNLVANCVRRLRQKMEDCPSRPRYIVSVPGVGYRLQNQQQWESCARRD